MDSDLAANKALVTGFFQRWSDMDLDGMCELADLNGSWWNTTFATDLQIGDWTDRIRRAVPLFSEPPKFVIGIMTAEDDRVSAIVTCHSVLADGRDYDNVYHYLIRCSGGRLVDVREFADPRLADAAFRPASSVPSVAAP